MFDFLLQNTENNSETKIPFSETNAAYNGDAAFNAASNNKPVGDKAPFFAKRHFFSQNRNAAAGATPLNRWTCR